MSGRVLIAGVTATVVVLGAAVLLVRQPAADGAGLPGCRPAEYQTASSGPPVQSPFPPRSFEPAEAWADDVRLNGAPRTGQFNDVAASATRAVAVGRTGTSRPLVAYSDDARAWHVAQTGDVPLDGELVDIAVGGPGWVAVGSSSLNDDGASAGAVWWSADGLDWRQAPPQLPAAYIHGAAVGADNMLAIASDQGGASLLGKSADGAHWQWGPYDANGGTFASLVWTGSEWLAVGSIEAGGGDPVPAIWTSADTETWDCRTLKTTRLNPWGAAQRIVLSGEIGMVLGHANPHCDEGSSCSSQTAGWIRSADDSWHPLSDEVALIASGAATGSNGELLSVTAQGIWRSSDGLSWELVQEQVPPGVPSAVVRVEEGLIAVGATYQGGATELWLGLLPGK